LQIIIISLILSKINKNNKFKCILINNFNILTPSNSIVSIDVKHLSIFNSEALKFKYNNLLLYYNIIK